MSSFSSVTEFISYVTDYLAEDDDLMFLTITGELSGVTVYRSGHCYFTLKDESSCVSCVMFRTYLSQLDFTPQDGMKVVITGSVNIYGPTGKFQINVKGMRFAGKGNLKEQYNKLFVRLQEEGLFSEEHKRRIPLLPRRIGVVTSPSGAVINDIIRTLKRRNPYFDILIYPASVQGEACPKEVANGIRYLDAREDIDVIIVARGGGSYEDLFGFSDEEVARACYAASTPVISAIGHETDNSILDYVADLRAPTPTAAAELVMPVYDDLNNYILNTELRLELAIEALIRAKRNYLESLKNHKALLSPMFYLDSSRNKLNSLVNELTKCSERYIGENSRRLEDYSKSLSYSVESIIVREQNRLSLNIKQLDSMGPTNVLRRGYSFVTNGEGKVVSSTGEVSSGDEIYVEMVDGKIYASVNKITRDRK